LSRYWSKFYIENNNGQAEIARLQACNFSQNQRFWATWEIARNQDCERSKGLHRNHNGTTKTARQNGWRG